MASRTDPAKRAITKPAPPDDGPDEMDLTIPRRRTGPINTEGSVFGSEMKEKFSGINSRPSVFEKGAVFNTGRQQPEPAADQPPAPFYDIRHNAGHGHNEGGA